MSTNTTPASPAVQFDEDTFFIPAMGSEPAINENGATFPSAVVQDASIILCMPDGTQVSATFDREGLHNLRDEIDDQMKCLDHIATGKPIFL